MKWVMVLLMEPFNLPGRLLDSLSEWLHKHYEMPKIGGMSDEQSC